jgi:hypothetical protein
MELIDAGDLLETDLILERERIAHDTASSAAERAWTDWLLRMIACDAPQAGWDFRAWIHAKREFGGDIALLDALERLLEGFYGPGEVPVETYDDVLEQVGDERSRLVIETFRRYDTIASHPHDFADETAADGLRLATVLEDDGARSYFLNVQAERRYEAGNAEAADAEGGAGAEILRRLAADDPIFDKQAAKATRNATSFAVSCGDFPRARLLAETLRGSQYAPTGDDPLAFLLEP